MSLERVHALYLICCCCCCCCFEEKSAISSRVFWVGSPSILGARGGEGRGHDDDDDGDALVGL